MGQEVDEKAAAGRVSPFNGAVEIGLRALSVLAEASPAQYSLERIVVCDYLVVHSDDIPGGPGGLHPRTPHRSGELLVRRKAVQEGLQLFESRGLIVRHYLPAGIAFSAAEGASAFLDVLQTSYVKQLRDRATWLVETFEQASDDEIASMVRKQVGNWGAEFTMESVLWSDEVDN